jgi:hypothetical protein
MSQVTYSVMPLSVGSGVMRESDGKAVCIAQVAEKSNATLIVLGLQALEAISQHGRPIVGHMRAAAEHVSPELEKATPQHERALQAIRQHLERCADGLEAIVIAASETPRRG